jgi:hypothetical protein
LHHQRHIISISKNPSLTTTLKSFHNPPTQHLEQQERLHIFCIKMSREVHFNPEEEPLLPADNPLVRELIDSVLREAQRIVKDNTSQFTAEQLIEAAQFWIPGDMPRLQKRKPQAWNLGLKNEKAFAPPELLKKTGVRKNGQAGLDGGYAKWFAERWKNEAELREKYQQMAARIAAADDDDAENDEQLEETRKNSKKRLQKNETKQLLKQVRTTPLRTMWC